MQLLLLCIFVLLVKSSTGFAWLLVTVKLACALLHELLQHPAFLPLLLAVSVKLFVPIALPFVVLLVPIILLPFEKLAILLQLSILLFLLQLSLQNKLNNLSSKLHGNLTVN